MTMIGTVRVSVARDGDEQYSVSWDFPAQNDPNMIVRTWKVTRIGGSRPPRDGDTVHYARTGEWVGLGYHLWTEDQAKLTERPIPPPSKKEARGRPVRYKDGRWEIQTAKGWR